MDSFFFFFLIFSFVLTPNMNAGQQIVQKLNQIE